LCASSSSTLERTPSCARSCAETLSTELEKRIGTIGRSRSFVDWEKRKGLVQELDHLRATIVDTLAPEEKQTDR
jgi:hypothetical protein